MGSTVYSRVSVALNSDVQVLLKAPSAKPSKKEVKGDLKISPLGVIAPPPIQVESPRFNGSLATLFSCVRDHKVNLLDVPLLPICEAYFLYLIAEPTRNLDEAAAALMALSYLLERKAWALLPVPEPEPESIEPLELIAPTTHEYDSAIQVLNIWQEEREKLFFRTAEPYADSYEVPFDLGNVSASDLARAFERLLLRAEPEPVQMLNKPRRSLSEQMKVVLKSLSKEWKSMIDLITLPFSREEAVYWFLAILELIRLGQATVKLTDDDVLFART